MGSRLGCRPGEISDVGVMYTGITLALVAASSTQDSDISFKPPIQPLLQKLAIQGRDLPTGTCNGDTPCVNAACCGTNGLCGYSPTECGAGNCTSNCDAKAQCGQYGMPGQQNCPLSVCCSQFGFCGSTSDFCDTGCQSGFGGCGAVNRPSCSDNTASKRTIGYYEAWANTRKCDAVSPEDLNLNGFTHINFAFAFFDPSSFQIAPMDEPSGTLYSRFTALKNSRSGLQTWISVGGWSFTDPGPTRTAFSDMTSSAGNRQKFISGLTSFMDHYGFDGVDLDWEYPQADDRGGISADTANYVSLVKELRAAFGTKYGISMTLPTSYWYLQHFDLKNIQSNVDWFNFMAYDLHGVWDAASQFVGPYIAPHTNITEIDMGMDLLWRAGVTPDKVVLGTGWYGRSFTLADPSCNTPNGVCQFTSGANAGPCTDASGILSLQEINQVISDNHVTPVWDHTAGVKWITWDSNQWVSYDDDDTLNQKRQFANSRCLGGTMVWAMDQVDQSVDNGLAPARGVTTQDQSDAKQLSDNLAAGITCYTTDCDQQCKMGTSEATQMNGQPNQLSTNGRCPAGQYRSLCCDDGTRMGTCQWRGYRGVGLSCMGGCADGETEVVTDTNSHDKKTGDQTCTGGTQSYCCAGFKPAPSGNDIKDQAEDAAKAAAEAAAEQAALDIAAKAFCRIAVPALLAPLELVEDLIPIFGEIADLAEIAATPALIDLCTKDIEKTGSAEFKVFGKKHTLSLDKPKTTKESRPSESSHSSASTSSCGAKGNAKRADNGNYCDPQFNKRVTTEIVDDFDLVRNPIGVIPCNAYGQACMNYRSISRGNANFHTLTCGFTRLPDGTQRPVSQTWTKQHKRAQWDGLITALPEGGCSPDEYPPAVMADVNDGYSRLTSTTQLLPRVPAYVDRGQMIRYVASKANKDAGNAFNKCGQGPVRTEDHLVESIEHGRRADTTWTKVRAVYTRKRFTLDFAGLANPADDGIPDNECAPTFEVNGVNAKHPGYALLNSDPWFSAHADELALVNMYAGSPPRRRRRWLEKDGRLVFVDANSTRAATPEELRREYRFDECADETCTREIEALKTVVGVVREEVFPTRPKDVDAEATPHFVEVGDHTTGKDEEQATSREGSRSFESDIPRETGGAL
ncbi:family 18 glycosyl hydrolase [Xylariaceae sp. FL1651]|nr:family 18 glycosyl hydrolase [Xylariaceae sp. FL1651]